MAAIDLADAVLQVLRASPAAAAFGDTWDPAARSGVEKLFGDWGYNPDKPYAVFEEIGETYEFYTAGPGNVRPYVATGTLRCSIFAASRAQARTLGVAVCAALNDADSSGFAWPAAHPMYLRMQSAAFVPVPQSGPDGTDVAPTVFLRVITFTYKYQGQL